MLYVNLRIQHDLAIRPLSLVPASPPHTFLTDPSRRVTGLLFCPLPAPTALTGVVVHGDGHVPLHLHPQLERHLPPGRRRVLRRHLHTSDPGLSHPPTAFANPPCTGLLPQGGVTLATANTESTCNADWGPLRHG